MYKRQLQYELNVAEIAATSTGLSGLKVSEMTASAFSTIGLVMTVGILGGVFCSIFFLKKYVNKLQKNTAVQNSSQKKPSFGTHATVAMFVGLCSAYIGSYIGTFTAYKDWLPLFVAGVSAAVMLIF